MQIVKKHLNPEEYSSEITEKTILVYHHTAGGHRPDWTIDGWERDKSSNGGVLPVATAYVIGGLSTRENNGTFDTRFDGAIYEAFPDTNWAYHLGISSSKATKGSIGIEICNYGPLHLSKEGRFLNYVNGEVPKHMVEELPEPFKGYKFYHKYTQRQLDSLKWLTEDIIKRHPKIDLKKGMNELFSTGGAFKVNQQALTGAAGLWGHTNYRIDKSDVYPQPQLIALIKSFAA